MKRFAFVFAFLTASLLLLAQDQDGNYNPFVNSGIITPAPLSPVEMGGAAVISFNFGNTGSDPLETFDGHEITLTITLSGGEPDTDALSALTGTARDLFSWTFDGSTYTGTQIATVNAGFVGTISIAYVVTENSEPGGSNGFNVNITPAPYQNTSNTPSDDAVSSYTYTEYLDFGDAPASYGSVSHNIDFSNYMGAEVDGEDTDLYSNDATGDDSDGVDDEDGVIFPAEIVRGTSINISVSVNGLGRIYGWIDWYGDGSFDDIDDLVIENELITENQGSVDFALDVPEDAYISGPTFARIRMSYDELDSSTGLVQTGEVEDYQITILCAPPVVELLSNDADNTFCALTPVTFTASGGSTYEFRVGGEIVQSGTSPTCVIDTFTVGSIVDVVAYDEIGCSATSTGISNTVLALPSPTLQSSDPNDAFCAGTEVSFNATGGNNYDFWVGGSLVQTGTETSYTTSSLLNNQEVYVVVTDGSNCSATSEIITNTVYSLPSATLTSSDEDDIICEGNSVTFTAGGGITYDFWVDDESKQNEADNSYTTISLVDGQGVFVIVTDDNTCVDTSDVITTVVNLNPTASAGVSPGDICQEGTTSVLNGIVGGSASGGIWSAAVGGEFLPNASDLNATWTPPVGYSGTATLVLTTTGGDCPEVTSELSQLVNPTPLVSITDPDPVCLPGTADLTSADITIGSSADLIFTYWTDAAGTTTYDTPETAPVGTYFIRGTSTAGCSDIQPVTVTAYPVPDAPVVSDAAPVNLCPDETVNLELLVTSSTPLNGAIYYKTSNDPGGADVQDAAAVGGGSYYLFYQSEEGCFSAGTEVLVSIDLCPPDVTPTVTVSPNVMNGLTQFNLIVKVTELNLLDTDGLVTINIPKDTRWFLTDGFLPLTNLGGTELENSIWTHSEDDVNHIFTTSSVIPAGGSSTFGFVVTFDPGSAKGNYTITTQIESGGGGEERVNNNVDSEKIDYFQD